MFLEASPEFYQGFYGMIWDSIPVELDISAVLAYRTCTNTHSLALLKKYNIQIINDQSL